MAASRTLAALQIISKYSGNPEYSFVGQKSQALIQNWSEEEVQAATGRNRGHSEHTTSWDKLITIQYTHTPSKWDARLREAVCLPCFLFCFSACVTQASRHTLRHACTPDQFQTEKTIAPSLLVVTEDLTVTQCDEQNSTVQLNSVMIC